MLIPCFNCSISKVVLPYDKEVEVANFTLSQSPPDFQEIRDLFSCYQNV